MKISNTWLWVGISILIILFLIGGAFLFYKFFFYDPFSGEFKQTVSSGDCVDVSGYNNGKEETTYCVVSDYDGSIVSLKNCFSWDYSYKAEDGPLVDLKDLKKYPLNVVNLYDATKVDRNLCK